jgi:iron(III) transport system ATP-binding protein
MLDLVKLTPWKDAYPHKLSGGQQQRVALARALAQGPELLLLDEPFSSLDTELRYQLSEDVRGILKKLNMTAIMVTHDQTEAFSFADKIGVMKEGRIEQFDVAYDIYHRPTTSFVAGFIGEGVIVPSELIRDVFPELNRNIQGKILIRPDDITHDDASVVKAKVFKRIFRGSHFLYVLDFDNGLRILSLVPSHHEHAEGDYIGLLMDLDHAVAFDA